MQPQLPVREPLLPPDPRGSRDSPSPCSHLLVEGVPAGVDVFHVMLQPLDITVFPGALDESLTNSIDLLQLQLEGIHLLLLELLWVEKVGEKR